MRSTTADWDSVEDAHEEVRAIRQRLITTLGWQGAELADELIAAVRRHERQSQIVHAAAEAVASGS